jgi:carboxyl-terminal processing protease
MSKQPTHAHLGSEGLSKTVRGRSAFVWIILACLGAAVLPAGCATAPKEPPLTQQQRQRNLESFDYVWTTIRDRHWDPELGGLDWDAVRDELRPQVEQATAMSGFRVAAQEMISRLDQSHFAVIPAEAYEILGQPAGEGELDGVTGLDLRVIDGHALVTSVVKDSPAAEAGVRPGWKIVRVGEKDIPPRLKAIAPEFEGKTWKDLVLARSVTNRLRGPVGDSITVTFLDGDDQTVQLNLNRIEKKGRKIQLGHLPASYVWIEVDTIDDNIGYIVFNMFMDPGKVMTAFNDAMKSFMEADGVIIDIRGNPGGIGAMAMGMAGWMIGEKNQHLGTMHMRANELKFIVSPRPITYAGPVVVLVDGLSGSTSEIFAGGVKDLGRACIVGSRTAGASLPSIFEMLPNGDGFQYAFANYISQGGEVLEGIGVIPDIEVTLTREALLEGRDPALEAAIGWIREQD